MKTPDYIERPIYIDRIMPYVQKNIIKILVGQRRVGKSYLLFQLMDRIARVHPECRQIYINKELHEFVDIRNAEDLLNYINTHRLPDQRWHCLLTSCRILKISKRLSAVCRPKEI